MRAVQYLARKRSIVQNFSSAATAAGADPQCLNTSVTVVEHPHSLNGYLPYGADKDELEQARKNLFAVVSFSGTQYKVAKDDVIVADKMNDDVDIGETVDLSDVLMVGSKAATVLGQPTIAGAKVTAVVEEITRDKKVITLKVRRRKNSRTKKGFRRQVTVLRIADIVLSDEELVQELEATVTAPDIAHTDTGGDTR